MRRFGILLLFADAQDTAARRLVDGSELVECLSSAPMRVVEAFCQATVSSLAFTGYSNRFLAEIVLKSLVECLPFLFLPSPQDLFPASVVHARRGHVADPFMVPVVVVERNELRHSCPQLLRAGVHQQVQPRLQRLVISLDLPCSPSAENQAA
jgi:hypothetical protein